MSEDHQPLPFFRVDLDESAEETSDHDTGSDHVSGLLRQMVLGQERQNELLEDLIDQLSARDRQRASDLVQWKQANPELASKCRAAAESLSRIQGEFLDQLTSEINDNFECLADGDFMLNEFVDRYGPRLAHLNGVLQVLSQLSSHPSSKSPT